MNTFFLFINLIFLIIIFLWAFYKAHISDKFINRATFALVGLSTALIFLADVVPDDSSVFYLSVVWQRLLFNACLGLRALAEFYCAYGSAKWKEAFTNSKDRFLHLTRS